MTAHAAPLFIKSGDLLLRVENIAFQELSFLAIYFFYETLFRLARLLLDTLNRFVFVVFVSQSNSTDTSNDGCLPFV